MRKAFSLLEMIFVIVVLGIVSAISFNIVIGIYEKYLTSKITNELEFQTKVITEQIASRLQYRIKNSVVGSINGANYKSIEAVDDTYDTLEWIGIAYESQRGISNDGVTVTLGWSGYINMNSSIYDTVFKFHTIYSPDTNLSVVQDIDGAIFNDIDVFTNKKVALVFTDKDYRGYYFGNDLIAGFGYKFDNNATGIFDITVINNDNFNIDRSKNLEDTALFEQYYLVDSAYALRMDKNINPNNDNDYNLTLYYDYRPWNGEKYSDINTKQEPLATNVESFRFIQESGVMRIRVCINHCLPEYEDINATVCKERAIF